jgi:hypothetical protein
MLSLGVGEEILRFQLFLDDQGRFDWFFSRSEL